MNWFRKLFSRKGVETAGQLTAIRAKFSHFLSLLEQNNSVLKIMSDLEEKSQGEYLFDINYLRSNLIEVQNGVQNLITEMITLGGEDYEPLRERYNEINYQIDQVLPGSRPIEPDDFTIPFDRLGRERAHSVGSKSAQLGEIRAKIGLPAPDGFAISGWAYKHFLDANNLQTRIGERIGSVDITGYEKLVEVSDDIRGMVRDANVPEDLADAIRIAGDALAERTGAERFSLRSSAIGEDTQYSFAGQYATCLGVHQHELVTYYLEILAGKFTPQAIYYYLSHSLQESVLAMSVGCVEMIDARASGVVYTRDPVRPGDDSVLVNSIYGLGKYLVDGTLTPDAFRISRVDGSVVESQIVRKPVRLVSGPEGGTKRDTVPEAEQTQASISESELRTLADYALKIEQHYGSPQDIEWALDQNGKLYLLQTRPLRVIEPATDAKEPDLSALTLIRKDGSTVCPGAGGGKIHHVSSPEDLPGVPDGAVLVAPQSFAGLITAMGRVSAIVTETGGTANHMATIAREYRIPTIGGFGSIDELPQGQEVTVDATEAAIYEGIQQELIEARQPEYELFDDMEIINLLKKILEHVSPLNLVHPTDPDFVPEKCLTFHDITRLCHQKAMDEMFYGGLHVEGKSDVSLPLKSEIPLGVNIIYVDESLSDYAARKQVSEDDIGSVPMTHFWNGVRHEGWPGSASNIDVKGFLSVLGTSMTRSQEDEFSESSFALLGREYMIISLRMGYHFTTIEGMCTEDTNKNYARMQYKEGGASMDRRERRIKLIRTVLSKLGFEHQGKGDFLDTRIAYLSQAATLERLFQLGRLTILTKQLDMALSNDSVAEWYTQDIMKKLGLEPTGEEKS